MTNQLKKMSLTNDTIAIKLVIPKEIVNKLDTCMEHLLYLALSC
jgi:hypothetical protein